MSKPARRRTQPLPALPARPASGHKGLFGRVLVVGGDASMFGAAVLAATAALRAGSGLVQVAVPRAVLAHAIAITPELIGLPLDEEESTDAPALERAIASADAIVVGPGMGRSPASARRLRRLLESGRPGVLDADALNLLAEAKVSWVKHLRGSFVLTPHPGEMARLLAMLDQPPRVPDDHAGRRAAAERVARTLGQVVLLKGHRTVIADGTRWVVSRTGDSTLSKAGAGDVLSGVIGSLIGQKMGLFESAVAGAWIHGTAGELAGDTFGRRGALARDVALLIPEAVRRYEHATRKRRAASRSKV